jgi:hypothetical protein
MDRVTREDVSIVYVAEPGDEADVGRAASTAFERLEAAIPPRGRKMYGYWDPAAKVYRACYARVDTDRPREQGLGSGMIPGGVYGRVRLRGEDVFGRIGQTFDALAGEEDVETTSGRPWFELYRRHDEVDLFVPLRSS